MALTVKDYQKAFILQILQRPACMLAAEMGTGKTVIAIKVMQTEHKINKQKSVVVCPAYLVYNWRNEVQKWWEGCSVSIHKEKGKPANLNANVVIVSYERAPELAEYFLHKVVVIDEAHYLSNGETKRSEFIQGICRRGLQRLLLMTGTPMSNRIPDLYHLLLLLDLVWPFGFRSAYSKSWKFKQHYCLCQEMRLPGQRFTIKKYYGSQNMEHLLKWLGCWWLKCKLADVVEMGGITEEEIIAPDIPLKFQQLLEAHWQKQNAESMNGIDVGDHEYGSAVGDSVSTAKALCASAKSAFTAEFVIELIKDNHGPIVVFSDHVQAAHEIAKIIGGEQKGGGRTCYSVKVITGETPAGRRQSYVDMFQRGELDVIVGTIGAMSTGITLTRANIMVVNDYSWVPGRNWQAKGRIYRLGQEKHCFVYTVTGGDIDRKIWKVLREKETIMKELMK